MALFYYLFNPKDENGEDAIRPIDVDRFIKETINGKGHFDKKFKNSQKLC